MNLYDTFVLDACVFPEGDFLGFADDVKASPLSAFFLTVGGDDALGAVRYAARVHQLADREEKLTVARTVNDLKIAERDGKIAAILYLQDPGPMGNSLELLRAFYEMGVRVIQMSYNKGGYMGTGCAETYPGRLTDFGREAVREMNRLGILIDLSHCCKETVVDAIEASEKPVTICHANIYNIAQNPRNKTDDVLKMLKDRGGVLGLTPWAPICWKGVENKQPTLDDYLDHVDYAVNLIGIESVGFASDNNLDHSEDLIGISSQSALYSSVVGPYNTNVGTDPRERHARGFGGAHETDNLVRAMQARGYREEDIEKFLGGNFLRVIQQTWR